ncbi:phage holin family protein [Vibrio metschnikovii]|uniref:phage holin family protein n=1 Tax=Vibrio metschnikovii TaxID=28172 RepID=UPI001C2FADDC
MPLFTLGAELIASVTILSLLSGLGSYLHGRRTERLQIGWISFLAEMTLALMVGLTVTYLCESKQMDRRVTMALVLILSNNGAETYSKFRQLVIERLSLLLTGGGNK